LDYLDTNSVPRNLAAGYTEAVPMVSEFQADYSASAVAESAPAVVNLTQLKVEMHYPFTRPSPYTFSLYTEWMATLQNKGSGQKMSVTGAVRRLPDCGYAPNVDVKKYFTKQGAGTPFSVQVDATNGQTLALSIGVRAWVAIADPAGGTNDTEVDSAPYPRNAFIMIPAIEFPAGPAVPVTSVGMECCDPRFNWDATDANFWRQSPSGGTLSRTNLYTRQYLANERGVDRGTDMYVSDAGRLQMVGELGALLASGHVRDRFKTIRLFERDQYAKMSGVLKYSCMTNSGTTTNALLRRGLVNMNTENTNALAAAFCGAPVEFGQTNSVVSWTDARLIAERMIRAGEFWDVSDIGSLTPPAGQGSKANINWTTEFPDLTDLQREAIISYSAGLLTVRQNLFLIALATDAFSMRVGGAKSGKGAVLASAYALATVWRDPFRDANGNHHWAIRDFRVLSY
jgi:hypothetical protein